ncbi:hypothetical protein ACNZ61_002820 [Enterococcus hirae]
MEEKKEHSWKKWLIFLVIYLFGLTPLSLIGYQLTPYIVKDQSLDLFAHIHQTMQHPIKEIKRIPKHEYWYVFLILEIMGFFLLVFYLNPKKEAGYQVVGRTMPVHGSASWGIDSELRAPKNVHFRKKKHQLRNDLERSIGLREKKRFMKRIMKWSRWIVWKIKR